MPLGERNWHMELFFVFCFDYFLLILALFILGTQQDTPQYLLSKLFLVSQVFSSFFFLTIYYGRP